MLLGVPRMRQIKIKNNSCKVPEDFKNEIAECFDVYNEKKEDDLSFGLINGSAYAASHLLRNNGNDGVALWSDTVKDKET